MTDNLITLGVPLRVVDKLHVVEVEENQAELVARRFCRLEPHVEIHLEFLTTTQSRHRVVVGVEFKLFVEEVDVLETILEFFARAGKLVGERGKPEILAQQLLLTLLVFFDVDDRHDDEAARR